MSSTEGTFSGRSNQVLHLDVSVANMGAYSTVSWNLYARRVSGTGSFTGSPTGSWSANIGGNTYGGAFPAYNLQANTTVGIASGAVNITNGNYISSSASASGVNLLGNAYVSAGDAMVPGTPGAPALSSALPTQITASWGVPGNGGSGIDLYRLYYGTSPTLSGAAYVDAGAPPQTVSGLTPGLTYYVGIFAHNALGFSAISGISSIRVGVGGHIWDGTAERPLLTAKIWNGTAEMDLVTALVFNGTAEAPAI